MRIGDRMRMGGWGPDVDRRPNTGGRLGPDVDRRPNADGRPIQSAYSFPRALAIPLASEILLSRRCSRVRPEAPPDHRSQGRR